MIESRPIPDLAKTAHRLLVREFQRDINAIGQQTVAALGLNEADNWTVDFDAGVLRREVADPPEAVP